jgi:hypothetical protein
MDGTWHRSWQFQPGRWYPFGYPFGKDVHPGPVPERSGTSMTLGARGRDGGFLNWGTPKIIQNRDIPTEVLRLEKLVRVL